MRYAYAPHYFMLAYVTYTLAYVTHTLALAMHTVINATLTDSRRLLWFKHAKVVRISILFPNIHFIRSIIYAKFGVS